MSRNLISTTPFSNVFPWELVGERCIKQLAVLFWEEEDLGFLCVVQHLTDSHKFLFPWNLSNLGNWSYSCGSLQVAHGCEHKTSVTFLAGWGRQKKGQARKRGGGGKESGVPTPPLLCRAPKIQIPVWPEMKLIALQEECGNNGLRTLWMNYALQARGSSAHRCPKLYFYVAHI